MNLVQTNSAHHTRTGAKAKLAKLAQAKTLFLVVFAVVYGLVFINYIDIITPGGDKGGYHLWLVLMYFVPFAILSVADIKNWKLTLGLGFLASLMNDVFYGAMRNVMGQPYDLERYYNLWLIPQTTKLFDLNLGFSVIEVQSWMMASSIYIRIATVFMLLEGWKLIPNWTISRYLTLNRLKIGNLKPIKQHEPQMMVLPPEEIMVEQ